MTFNTGNPVGSVDPRDLYDNAKNADIAVNTQDPTWTDRLGVERKSWAGIEQGVSDALSRLGYQVKGDYAADLLIENYGEVFRKDGEFYRAKAETTLPYPLNGDWAVDAPKFVSVGDAVLRQELADANDPAKGAALIGYKGGTLAEFLSGVGGGVASLSEFGAIGDGVTDDTAAVRSAIKDGRAIDWGTGTYLITEEISETIAHAINWASSGAKIIYSPAAPTQNCIRLKVYPHRHVIRGVLSLQLNKLAFNGLYLLSEADTVDTAMRPLSYPDLIAVDVHVDGAYRASTAFTGGNSVLIEGAWNHVSVIRPRLTNQKMAVGAQVSGEQGIFGLSIVRLGSDTAITPHEIYVEDPYIDTVVSEDDTYQMDQDGMRLFTSYNFNVNRAPEFSWYVNGGTIRNCRNREIKGQSNAGRVVGTKLIRTGETGGAATGNSPSIDQQIGPCTVMNLEFNFRDHAPLAIISDRTRVEDYVQPTSQLVGCKGLVSGNAFLPQLVFCTVEAGAPNRHRMVVSDVDVVTQGSARVGQFALVQTSNVTGAVQGPPKPTLINATNVTLPARDQWITASAVGGGFFNINLTNCHNTISGDVPMLVDSAPGAGRIVSAVQCSGFTPSPFLRTSTGNVSDETRVTALAPKDAVLSGLIRPIAFTLNDGASYVIPFSSLSGSIGNVLILGVSRAVASSQGIFLCGSQSISAVGTVSTDWAVGTTSEPSTGSFKIWATASGITVKNAQGSTRTFTGLLIG